ncbi:MAG TPA: VPDSG-CTERM sorting domain-containing protein [Verrucomicrobiae bacterium]
MNVLKRMAVFVATVAVASFSAQALTITSPITYTHSASNPIVGTFDTGTSAADVPTVTGYLNQLLGLGADAGPTTISGVIYKTSSVDYNGSLLPSAGTRVDTGNLLSVAAGYDYVVAKYDGKNAGYVVWYLGGQSATLPEYSNNIWQNGAGAGYQISGYTAYRSTSVPDGGATAAFLGVGLLGLAAIRRKK